MKVSPSSDSKERAFHSNAPEHNKTLQREEKEKKAESEEKGFHFLCLRRRETKSKVKQ